MKTLIEIVRRVFARCGLFVAGYSDQYVYVPRHTLWNPKRPPADTDFETFKELADRVAEDARTFLGYDRLYVLWQAVRNVSSLEGAAVEVGSFRGGSASFIGDAFRTLTGRETELHVIDTFEGHPDCIIPGVDREDKHKPGMFSETSYEDVRAYLAPFEQTQVHQGDCTKVIKTLPEKRYRFVHLDVDLFQPTLNCLEYFDPRLAAGGVVVLDDYGAPKCPGVEKALDEFLAKHDGYVRWFMHTEQAVLVRRS